MGGGGGGTKLIVKNVWGWWLAWTADRYIHCSYSILHSAATLCKCHQTKTFSVSYCSLTSSHMQDKPSQSCMLAPGDAELASIAAGLTVEKAGQDTLSISDSALGESSVISGTTAGVTQFSEVSKITVTLILAIHSAAYTRYIHCLN